MSKLTCPDLPNCTGYSILESLTLTLVHLSQWVLADVRDVTRCVPLLSLGVQVPALSFPKCGLQPAAALAPFPITGCSGQALIPRRAHAFLLCLLREARPVHRQGGAGSPA